MLALISPAKTMVAAATPTDGVAATEPRFMEHTRAIATLMLAYSSVELEGIFKVSRSIAGELSVRFAKLAEPLEERSAAIDSYDGVVYRHIKGEKPLTKGDLLYLQERVRISSLLYGLLRPLDAIKPYRMEGFVRLAGSDERIDNYWRDRQTSQLIDDVNESGGTLLYLASKEEQRAFHWKQVKSAVRVIDIQFLQYKGDKLRQVVIYTKMARGEMVRYMAEQKITDPEALKSFEWSGYSYSEELSDGDRWVWLME